MLLGEDAAVRRRSTAHYGSSLSEGHTAVPSPPHEAPMVRDYAALHPLTIWLSWGLQQHIASGDTIRFAIRLADTARRVPTLKYICTLCTSDLLSFFSSSFYLFPF